MRSFAVEVETDVAEGLDKTFERIVPIHLPSVFPGYGPLPAVTGTLNQTGAWDAAGQTRTVILSDGSTAHEQLTEYRRPHYFAYMVSDFTGPFRSLVNSAHGQWWFDSNASSTGTHIRWRYALVARSALSAPVVWFVANFLWRGYMSKSLQLSKLFVEKRQTPNGQTE